jgi:predicted metal-binding protein
MPYEVYDENGKKMKKRPSHPHGCPNFIQRNPLCPPIVSLRSDILEKYNRFTLVYAVFDFQKYKQLMYENARKEERRITDKQVKCVLYWQGQLKKVLKEYIQLNFYKGKEPLFDEMFGAGSGFKFYKKDTGNIVESPSMEAVGIRVFTTLKRNKISYEIKPKNKILMVTLLCCKT